MEKSSTLYSKSSLISSDEETSQAGVNPVVDLKDRGACPGNNVINNILSFSKALQVIPSGEKSLIGAIEIVIN